ncbi:hypothetical protein [Nocardioides montaniterrae]
MHPLTEVELAVLHRLVSVEFDGVEQLRAQVEGIREVEPNCTCGCPSFTPSLDRSTVPAAPYRSILPTELVEDDRPDGIPRTVIWFADTDGYISNVECVYYDDALSAWPDLSRCTVLALRR